jgi:hypothetical protein
VQCFGLPLSGVFDLIIAGDAQDPADCSRQVTRAWDILDVEIRRGEMKVRFMEAQLELIGWGVFGLKTAVEALSPLANCNRSYGAEAGTKVFARVPNIP